MTDDFFVFLCDCDGIWQLADRNVPENSAYFPTLAATLTVLPILRSIGHLSDALICDFKEWAVLTDNAGVLAQSDGADMNGLMAWLATVMVKG